MPNANTDLGITLNARVDTSQAQKDIDAFTRSDKSGNKARNIVLKADVDLQNISEKLSHAIDKGLTKNVDASMQKVSTTIKSGLARIVDGETFNDLTKVTERFKSDLGEIKERVTVFRDGSIRPLTSSLQTIKQGVEEITKSTSSEIKEIDGVTQKITTLEETIRTTDGDTKTIIHTTSEWIDSQGRLNQEIQVTDKNGKLLSATTKNISEDTKKATKLMNEFAKATQKLASADGVKRTETKTWIDKDGVKTVEEYTNGILTLTTRTKEYTNTNKELVVETSKFEGAERKLVSVHTEKKRNLQEENKLLNENVDAQFRAREEAEKAEEAQRKLNEALVSTTTTRSQGRTSQFGDDSGREYDAIITRIEKVDAANKKVIQTTYEFTNAQGQLVRQMRTTDELGNKVAEDTIEISDANNKAAESTKNYNTATQQATVETKTFGQALSDALARLARYYIASIPIQAFRKGLSEAITTVKEFDSALIEFRKVSDLAGESLTRYVAKLAEMGELTGSTMQAMVEASTEFRKSGFTDSDSATLASVAEMYRNIADEEISAGESASFIIAQMKAFNIEADQAEHIIDSVNEVANNFSVSSADLAKNLGNMSAIMAINNVSMEEQIGMLTGVTEITRNASSASRGLVMISSRLTQVLDDTSSTGKKLTKIYSDLGIELKDESGQLRSHYDILEDLATKWDSLSENQQKYIALTSAGARQQQNFVALMQNWNQVASATATAYQSIGSAQKENEKVMDSVAKKVEILKSEFQQLVIGKGGLQSFAKGILDIGIALLKFANSDIGKTILQSAALIASLALLQKGFSKILSSILNAGKALATYALTSAGIPASQAMAAVSTMSLGEAFQFLTAAVVDCTAALLSNPFTLAAVAAAGLVVALVASHNAVQKLNEELEQAKQEVVELTLEIDTLHAQEVKEGKLSQAEKDRLAYLEKRLQLQKEIVKTHEKLFTGGDESPLPSYVTGNASNRPTPQDNSYYGANAAQYMSPKPKNRNLGDRGFSSSQANKDNQDNLSAYIQLNKEIAEWNDHSEKGLELLEQKYEESQKYLPVLEAERDRLGALRDKYNQNNQEYETLLAKKQRGIPLSDEENTKLQELSESQKELSINDQYRLEALENNIGAYEQSIDTISSYQEAIDEFGEESEEADSVLTEFAKDLGISEEELLANADAMHLSVDAYYEYASAVKSTQDALKETSASIDGLQDALSKAQTALDEYTQQGYLTLDTFQDLMSVSAEYLTALINEEGQLEINQTTLANLVNQLKTTKIEELQAAEMADILAYAHGDVAEMSALAQTSVTNAGSAAVVAGNNASKGATGFWSLAEAISAANDAANGGVIDASHVDANIQKIHNAYKKLADSIRNTEVNTTKAGNAATSAGNKAKSAAGGAKKATDDLTDSVKDLKSQYDKVISYITGKIDDYVKSLQKAKDAAVKAVDEEIKAKEKQKDKELDRIESQIKALEKEKKAREKYWDDQIDALKKANKETKDAIELQEKLDALEKAKNTRVKIYKEGQGFVYDVDRTAVEKAQKELDEYLSEQAYEKELERLNALKDAESENYEKRLEALNEYKDKVQASYEKQIEALEEHKKALEEQYDAQIEYYNNFKENFEKMVKAYEDSQTALLAKQLTGIDFEKDNWMTRLGNLAEFVNKYNALQKQIGTGTTDAKGTADMSSGNPYTGGSDGKNLRDKGFSDSRTSGGEGLSAAAKKKLGIHASGIGSIKDDEIAIVGENPNQEIVIGSKVNNGALMSLNSGTGVVNADSSKTLASMLNQVGQFGSSGFGSGNGTLNSNINNDSLTINGVTIQGANIKDPETFVNGLLNLKAEALQRAYRHR